VKKEINEEKAAKKKAAKKPAQKAPAQNPEDWSDQ
jgi:hypothetical protein